MSPLEVLACGAVLFLLLVGIGCLVAGARAEWIVARRFDRVREEAGLPPIRVTHEDDPA